LRSWTWTRQPSHPCLEVRWPCHQGRSSRPPTAFSTTSPSPRRPSTADSQPLTRVSPASDRLGCHCGDPRPGRSLLIGRWRTGPASRRRRAALAGPGDRQSGADGMVSSSAMARCPPCSSDEERSRRGERPRSGRSIDSAPVAAANLVVALDRQPNTQAPGNPKGGQHRQARLRSRLHLLTTRVGRRHLVISMLVGRLSGSADTSASFGRAADPRCCRRDTKSSRPRRRERRCTPRGSSL
jgi:hypothetical protein